MVSSCDQGEDIAPIVDLNKPTMTITADAAVTVDEGAIIPVTFTLSAPVGEEFRVYIMLEQSSTANGLDSDVKEAYQNNAFQKTIKIPPFVTTFTTFIEIKEDVDAEALEHLIVTIGDTRTTAVIFEPKTIDVSINNVVANALVLDFHFDKTFGVNGYSNTLCNIVSDPNVTGTADKYDIDFIVYDENGVAVNNPGATGAQTGACTESLTFKLADYADGRYDIYEYLYGNASLDLAGLTFPLLGLAQFDIPITVDYSRSGSINGVYTQESANFFNSNTPVDTENYVMSVVIATDANGVRTFTIQNGAGIVSATGKQVKKSGHINRRK
ncbi:hypothetical protein [Flavobacterium sp. GT3R68]|uniref:hypothetical protein n=1 Tax=Flavobacterium sp. GT3R68 TaxID=2594437 RepID=UPI0011852E46|nr:hypothetical protein [Flavobacterium sp. GT3R68]TRW90558.1 hypothetical protein FNW07_11055 [Flavobacterium sp. GT3R68]